VASCLRRKKFVFENRRDRAAEQIVLLDHLSVAQGATVRHAAISRAVITEILPRPLRDGC
jgi:hypothetical protein